MNLNTTIRNLITAALAGASVFYVIKFDSLHKIPGISLLADTLMPYPMTESLVLGALLGIWAICVFFVMWRYFSVLHEDYKLIPITPDEIRVAAENAHLVHKSYMIPVGAGVTSFLGALSIVGILQVKLAIVIPNLKINSTADISALLISQILLSPLVETLLSVGLLEICRRWINSKIKIVIIFGIFWAALHAYLDPLYFFSTIWMFFIFSDLYLRSRDNFSVLKAGLLMWIAHLVNNFLAFFIVLFRM
jgi:hypothetical protein